MKRPLKVIAMWQESDLLHWEDEIEIVTGVGGLNVYETLKNIDRDRKIINIGYAGSNVIPIGEKVKIGKVERYHPNVSYAENKFLLNGDVPCYTSCDFVTQTEIKEPCVFDMELAFILAMGFTNVEAYKVVSDCLNVNQFEKVLERMPRR